MARRHITATQRRPLMTVLTALAISLALSACTTGPTGHPGPGGLWLEKAELLQAANPALVAQYNVNFVVAEQAEVKRSETGPRQPALRVHLQGIDEGTLRDIAQTAYDDFIDKLKARGFALSTRHIDEQLSPFAIRQLSKNTVQGIGKNVAPFRQYSENRIDTLTVGPEQLPVIRPDQHLAIAIAAGENGTRPITVDYTLRFATLDADGPAQHRVADTGISFTPLVELIPGSHLSVYHNPKKVGTVTLREPITARRASQSRELRVDDPVDGIAVYRYSVNPQQFREDTLGVLRQANSRLVNAL